jgi:hypothetical protein
MELGEWELLVLFVSYLGGAEGKKCILCIHRLV